MSSATPAVVKDDAVVGTTATSEPQNQLTGNELLTLDLVEQADSLSKPRSKVRIAAVLIALYVS